MDTIIQNTAQEQQKLMRKIERVLEDDIGDKNILLYIFGTDDICEVIEESLYEYRQYPLYMKNILSLTFYFSYACYRYDIEFGDLIAEKMTKHNSRRVVKSLRDTFVKYPVTQELIQFVLTDIQFDLAHNSGELKDIFADISNRDMSRFSFNPYFNLIASYDKNPSRFQCENKLEMLQLLKELLEVLTFLHHYELQQQGKDMFRFVCKNGASCEFRSLPMNHIFFQDSKYFGGIYHLFSIETRTTPEATESSAHPTVLLRYFSGSNSLTLSLPSDEDSEDDASHLADQRPGEVYMEVTGWEISVKNHVEKISKSSGSIDQIHTINYKYIKNLALAISDAISANDGSKEKLKERFGKQYGYIFNESISNHYRITDGSGELDWDSVVIMLLIEASPTTVLEHLMWKIPQTFYDIVNNLYKRTNLSAFKLKDRDLKTEIRRIHDENLIIGEAGGFGKISKPEPSGRLLARAQAMFIISRLSMMQEKEQDEKLIYTGNLRSNISLLQNMASDEGDEKRVRYACIILSETLKHLMCFYSGLYKYGEVKAEYDTEAANKCLNKTEIETAQEQLEEAFFTASRSMVEELSKETYETDRPSDTLRLFKRFIDFCFSGNAKTDSRYLYTAVGKYEIVDKYILNKAYNNLSEISKDPYNRADALVNTTLEILEYFKTGSFSNTPYNHNLFNTIYPFTTAFNRGRENPDGHKTVNVSLNIDIDNDNVTEFQTDVNVLSEFSFVRSEVYYCLPNVIRSNHKWWFDPVLINFKKFNDIFIEPRKEDA